MSKLIKGALATALAAALAFSLAGCGKPKQASDPEFERARAEALAQHEKERAEGRRADGTQDQPEDEYGDEDGSADAAAALGPPQMNPLGFSVATPEGWVVNAQTLQAVDIISPDGKDAAMIRVRTIPGGDTDGWLAREFLKGERWATRWQAQGAPPVQAGVSRMGFDITRNDGMQVHASALAIRSGRIATVMLAVAPAKDFEAHLPTLAATLQSFSFGGGGGAQTSGAAPSAPAPSAQLHYVVWVDPRENAFSVEVPQGWQVDGGTVRPDASGVRTQLVITAPAGRHVVWYGDWNLPRMFIHAGSAIRGLGPQQGATAQAMVNYQDAPTFAANYLQQRFGQLQITNVTQLPQIVERYQRLSQMVNKPTERHSAALIEYRMADGRMGAAQIVTSVTPNGFDDGATWVVSELSGFMSAPQEMNIGAEVWAHGRKTNHVNPQWFAGEMGAQGQAAADFQRSRDEISAIQAGIVEQRWASNQRIADQSGQILRGTTELIDPATGQHFETQATSKYYFRDVTGVAENNAGGPVGVGQDADFNPAPGDFRRLLEIQSNGTAQ